MTMQTEQTETVALPQHIGNHLAVAEFRAENPVIEHEPKYNEAVNALAAQLRDGEITLDDARAKALDALINSVFPEE